MKVFLIVYNADGELRLLVESGKDVARLVAERFQPLADSGTSVAVYRWKVPRPMNKKTVVEAFVGAWRQMVPIGAKLEYELESLRTEASA